MGPNNTCEHGQELEQTPREAVRKLEVARTQLEKASLIQL